MNGIEKITARIEADAAAEREQILREAEEKAAAIRADYAARARSAAEKAAESGEAAAAQREQRMAGSAAMEAKTMTLAAKQAIIDEAFARAKEELLAMDEAAYVDLLADLAVRSAKTGREEILLNEKDHDRLGAKVVAKANALLARAVAPELPGELKESKAGRIIATVVTGASALLQGTAMLTLANETRPIEGGLILRDGKVEINCAFETQLRLLRETMAGEVAGVLFP